MTFNDGLGAATVGMSPQTMARKMFKPIPPPAQEGDDLPADMGNNVMRALSVEIQRIAAVAEKTPSPRAFFLIGRLATMARDLKALDVGTHGCGSSGGNGDGMTTFDWNVYQNPTSNGVLAPAPQAETFGVNAIREVVAAASRRKPEEIVAAIVEAKKAGMNDLVRALRAQLGCDADIKPARAKRSKSTWGKKVTR